MFKICVVVLAVLALAHGFEVEKRGRGGRRGGRGGGCRRATRCIENIDIDADTLTQLESLPDAVALDHICTALGDVKTCISGASGSCFDSATNKQVKSVMDVVDYMCSDEGKRVILELANSPCADDPMMEITLQTGFQGCLEDFELQAQLMMMTVMQTGGAFSPSDMCPLVDDLKYCMMDTASDHCGSGFGTFIGTIWDIAAGDQFAELGCTPNTIVYRRMVKTAIPMVLKRAAYLAKRR